MTSLEEGFFSALQQEPEDDATRLIYADFLEEGGDDADTARAEFIRVQVELANLAPLTPREVAQVEELTKRQDHLLSQWKHVWLGGWAGVLDGWTFRRGFLEGLCADASLFLDHAEEWFATWPTLAVAKLTRAGGHLPELAASPWLAHLRGLDLSENDIDSAALAHLTSSRFICLLRALDLSGNPIGPRGAALVPSAPFADELSELHVGRCLLRGDGLMHLLHGRGSQWRRLDLSWNGLDRRALVSLVDSSVMRNLTSLDLASNPLDENGIAVLADSPHSRGLIDLGLCCTKTGDAGLTAVATSPHLTCLRSLDLRGHLATASHDRHGVLQGGVAELSRSPLLSRLCRLLMASSDRSNGWVADVLRDIRPVRRQEVFPLGWYATVLRSSSYLMPSMLIECDVEKLWWLGDRSKRQRLPNPWFEGDW